MGSFGITPMERNRWMLALGPSFWAGCFAAPLFQPGAWPWALALAGVGLFLLARFGGRKGFAGAMLCAAALGLLWTTPRLTPAAPSPGTYGEITGFVYGEPKQRSDERLTFTLTDIRLDGESVSGRAYCSLYYEGEEPPELYDGAELRFEGRVYQPDGKSGAPRFDFRQWMLKNGMPFGITISKGVEVRNTPESARPQDAAERVRRSLNAALTRVMGEEAGVASAMLFNHKEAMSEDETAAFRTLGIAHVTAVSGLHVGILAAALLPLLRRFRAGRKARFVLLALFLLAYSWLTGFSAASLRASVMFLLGLLAQGWNRKPESLSLLGTAMIVVLLLRPLDANSAGFVLSFSAMGAILLLAPGWQRWAERRWPEAHGRFRGQKLRARLSHLAHQAKRGLCVSLAAQLGVLLPTALYFHQLPLYGVAVNVLLLPLIGLLVPLYAVTLLCSWIPGLGTAVGFAAALLTKGFTGMVSLLSQLPYASVRVAEPSAIWLMAAPLLLIFLSPRVWLKPLSRCAAILLTALIAVGGTWLTRPPETRYVQLSVGQADAALLFDGDKTVGIDIASDGSAVIDYLLAEGRDLDALYLTHLHLDHAGGLSEILDAGIQIRQIYVPWNAEEQRLDERSLAILALARERGIPITSLARGDELRYNKTAIQVKWPDRDCRRGQNANDLPLVLRIDLDGALILNTSDLTGSYERYAAAPCDVLKVAHHGSRDSSGEEFLAFVSPKLALISCSSTSRSLPGAETLERLAAQNIPVLRTDQSGDVTLFVENGRLQVRPYRLRSLPGGIE